MTECPPWRDTTKSLPERHEAVILARRKAKKLLDQSESAKEFVEAKERQRLRAEAEGKTRRHNTEIDADIVILRNTPGNLIYDAWQVFTSSRDIYEDINADYKILDRAEWRSTHGMG